MQRFLVAFEAPPVGLVEDTENEWDGWVRSLADRGLQLVSDLDPVAEFGGFQVFEAVAL